MTFQLITAFLQSILQLGGTLGDGKLSDKFNEKLDLVLAALNVGRAFIAQGNIGAEDLRKLTAEIDAMVAAGVNPSTEQIAAMKARFQAAVDVAQKYLDEHEPEGGSGGGVG